MIPPRIDEWLAARSSPQQRLFARFCAQKIRACESFAADRGVDDQP
jgi:hypothetical protein